jgi:hypothetical protein
MAPIDSLGVANALLAMTEKATASLPFVKG